MENFLRCIPILFLAVLLFLTPNLSRRGLLFAIPVALDFRASDPARQAIALFRRKVVITAVLAVVLDLLWQSDGVWGALLPLVVVLLSGAFAFYQSNRRLSAFRVVSQVERSIDLTAAPARLPRACWLAAGPLLLLALVALYLHAHWAAIPEKVPVHFGINGTPDRWLDKGFKGVYGPLLLGAEICVWLGLLALATWFGARASVIQSGAVNLLVAVEYFIAVMFSLVPLASLFAFSPGLPLLLALAPLPLLVIYMWKKAADPTGAVEKTPDECWKAGIIYYNPNDPVLVVEKRTGFGYTLNMANPWSWALMAMGILALTTGTIFLA